MTRLVNTLIERRIWRVLVAYPSVTFIWLQVVEFFINNYDFDPRLLTLSLITAVLLFPAAVVWNWRHGEAGDQPFSTVEIGAYGVFGVIAILGGVGYWQATPQAARPIATNVEPVRVLAVMPFENANDDPDVQFLCDGIAESLINWLATVQDIKVVSKSASFRHRADDSDTAAIAAALGVDGIVRGRLEKVDDHIVISTSLVDARDESQIWGDRLVRRRDEVIYLERSIVEAIKDGLRLEVSQAPSATVATGGTDNAAAYEHYLRGHYLIQSTNMDEIYQGLDELRRAIDLDPEYARPHADIADALTQMIYYGIAHGGDLLREAKSAAHTAVALAPDLPEAHTALATMLQHLVFDRVRVEEAFEAAIALSPQSPVPYHRYADYLVFTLQTERARDMAARAIELDALDSSSIHAVGFSALFDGDFAAAAAALGDWNRFHPNSRWSYIKHAVALALDDQCDAARVQALKVVDLLDGRPSPLMDSWIAWSHKVCGDDRHYQASIGRISASLADHPDAMDPGYAYLYALEGDVDLLLDFLYRIADTRHPLTFFIGVFQADHLGWAISDTMPGDPRYLALLERLNLPRKSLASRLSGNTTTDSGT